MIESETNHKPEDEIVHYAELGNTVIVGGIMITPELAKRWNEYLKTHHND